MNQLAEYLSRSKFFREQAPIFKEMKLDHLLYGGLFYEEMLSGQTVFHYGDEPAEKFYQILDGEVSIQIP